MSKLAFSLHFFVLLALHAVALTLMGLFWKTAGYSPMMISLAAASLNIGGIVGAPLLLRAVRHRVTPGTALIVVPVVTALGSILMFLAGHRALAMGAWLVVCVAHAGSLPLLDFLASRQALAKVFRYERVRVWGSLGFVAGGQLAGVLVDYLGERSIPLLMAAYSLAVICSAVFLARCLGADATPTDGRSRVSQALPWRSFAPLVVIVFLAWCSHAPLYAMLSVYLEELGWSATWISIAWNTGVVAEVCAFLAFSRLERVFSLPNILILGVGGALVRWLLLGSFSHPAVVLAAQALHACSYACTHVVSLKLMHQILPSESHASGQAALASFAVGPGLLVGTLGAGWLARGEQPLLVTVPFLFYVCAALAAVGMLLAILQRRSWRTAEGRSG